MRKKLIAVYFGRLPNYFEGWIYTCSLNKTTDFLFITDDKNIFTKDLPKNIEIIYMTILDLEELVSNKIGMDVSIKDPYKVTDFKVTWGLVFDEYLEGYDYWGYCDIDIFWGNIDKFVLPFLNSDFDKIGETGHCTFYKNTNLINKLFLSDNGFFSAKRIFKSKECYAFDEMPGINKIFERKKFKVCDSIPIFDISNKYRKKMLMNFHNKNSQVFILLNGETKRYYIENKKILEDEAMYLHFSNKNINTNIKFSTECLLLIEDKRVIEINYEDINGELLKVNGNNLGLTEKIDKIYSICVRMLKILKSSNEKKYLWYKQRQYISHRKRRIKNI